MTKLEYGDYYRFLVSVGIALIVVALLFPWLVLSEPFDLLVTSAQLRELTPDARELILRRQSSTSLLVGVIPWVSGVLAVAGILFVVVGLRHWRRRQGTADEEQDLRAEKLRKELQAMSADEVEQRTEHEVASREADPLVEIDARVVSEYRQAEIQVAVAFEKCLGGPTGHIVLRDRRIGQAQYDLVVQQRSGDGVDLVVEVKFIRKGFHFGWLSEVARRVAVSAQAYGGLLRPSAGALLVIGVPPELLKEERLTLYVELLAKLGLREPGFRLQYIDSSRLDALTCETIEEWTEGMIEGSST